MSSGIVWSLVNLSAGVPHVITSLIADVVAEVLTASPILSVMLDIMKVLTVSVRLGSKVEKHFTDHRYLVQ